MNDSRATTRSEAEAQTFALPDNDKWEEFALLVDGYAICQEMGVNWGSWRDEHLQKLDTDPDSLTVLDARMLVFFEARAMRFIGGYEPAEIVNRLLSLIARKTDLDYVPMTAEEIEQREQRAKDVF